MMKNAMFATAVYAVLLAMATSAYAWNLDERYVNALRFQNDGTIQFTLFDSGLAGPEFICNPDIPTIPVEGGGQWFVISSCDHRKGNSAAAVSNCLASVDRMAEMLLKAKLEGVPVHVTRDRCAVTETALKPLP